MYCITVFSIQNSIRNKIRGKFPLHPLVVYPVDGTFLGAWLGVIVGAQL